MVIKLNQFFLVAAIILVIDQVVKGLVVAKSSLLPLQIIPNILAIAHTQNTGIAFGLFQGNNILLIIISIIIAAVIIVYRKKLEGQAEQLAGALILGGTLSNLADRLFRGAVVDYIATPVLPTFNIADAALTIGAALIITAYIKEKFSAKDINSS